MSDESIILSDGKVGDVLGTDPQPGNGPGKGEGAGDQPSEDYYDAEVNMEELQSMLFDPALSQFVSLHRNNHYS